MKIKKYQSGGITYLPTVNRIEGAATTAASSSSSSSESSKVPGFAKEIISLIKENGIESDVNVFLSSLQRTLDVAGDPSGENLSMRDILRVLKDVNKVKQNHDQYLTAEKSLEAQDAWAEPATDARGYLYVMDSDRKVSRIHPSEYDPEKYVSLTNLDLMHIRQIDPSKAYDSEILKNLSSAVGMKTISDYARSVIKDFGKTDITGYSEKTAGKIKSGMDKIIGYGYDDLSKLLFGGPDGVYKTNKVGTIADEDIRLALDYLKSSLPNSYRNTLNAKATAEGYNPDLMLITMLRADTDRKISVDYDHTASEDAGIGLAGKRKEAETKLDDHDTYLMRIATGGVWEVANILPKPNNPNDTASMMVRASRVGPLVDDKGDVLQIGNLTTVLEKLEAAKATNSKDVTFGDQLLDLGERGAVVWDGESQLTDVWLPYKTEGGKVKPDFAKLQRFNEFNKAIEDNPNMSTLEKSNLMWSLGLRPEELDYDPETNSFKFKESIMKMFLSFSAIASGNNLDLTDESERMLEEVDKDTGKHFVQLYNNAIKYNTIARTKSTKAVNTSYKKGKKGNLYRGNVYIPIDNEYLALHMSTNQNIPKSELTRFAAKVQATDYINSNRNDDLTGIGQFK